MGKRAVYVVDDEEPIRRSACLLLKVSGFATAAFADGVGFLGDEPGLDPGCILLDIRMPDLDGISVQRELQRRASQHATVVMTGHGEVGSAVAALDSGAVTFVEKPFSKTQLLAAVELAFQKIEDPDGYRMYLDKARERVDSLGYRERTVLSMLAENCSAEEIAGRLALPRSELDISRARLLEQLEVDSVPAALTIAFAAVRSA